MFTIPNGTSSSDYTAKPDAVDYQMIEHGTRGDGVFTTSDFVVTQRGAGANMSIDYTAGTVLVNDVASPAVVAGNVAISAADPTNPRADFIYVTVLGVVAVTPGTPAATPLFPAIPANSVVVAAVFVGPGVTSILNANIIDKRFLADYDSAHYLYLRANF